MLVSRLVPLIAGSAIWLTACAAEPGRAGTPGVPITNPAQPAQQGFGTSQEDLYVTQRGGRSAGMQGGRITGMTGMEVGVTREGTGTGIVNPRLSGIQQEGGGNITFQREGVGAPPSGSGVTRREQQRRQQRTQQPAQGTPPSSPQ